METLADAGLATIQRFRLLEGFEASLSDDNERQEWQRDLFLAQFRRFELWAVNLGLFVMGHGSLDYRIRDSESMKEAILKMIQTLFRSIGEVLDYISGNVDQEDEESETESGMESDIDLLLDSVRDPVDRLYKMAVWIRNPATRLPFSRARNFQQIDTDTNIDLFTSFESFDYDHVRSLFLQYEKDKALQEHPPTPFEEDTGGIDNDDQVWEPIRTILNLNRQNCSNGNESYLIRRIAQANGRRRQQFAYWRYQRDKLRELAPVVMKAPTHDLSDPRLNMEVEPGNVQLDIPLSVTTSTRLRLLHGAEQEVMGKADLLKFAVSEYAPSASGSSDDTVFFPSPPKASRDEASFECPYCFTICPASLLSEQAWRAHLIRDLRPYICTFEHCSTPEQLYDSRDDWIQHETLTHQAVFRCLKHEEQTFSTIQAYEAHTQEHQTGETFPLTLAKSTTDINRSCPVCSVALQTTQKLQSHIALHLERFAMFALPRSTGEVEKEDFEIRSTGVRLDSNGFRDGESDSKSRLVLAGEYDSITSSTALEALAEVRDINNEVRELLSSPTQPERDFFLQMGILKDRLKLLANKMGAWAPSDTVNSFYFEYGQVCLASGMIKEAILALQHLDSVQVSELDPSDPALQRTRQQLLSAYRMDEMLKELDEVVACGTDTRQEPGRSRALDIFARTEAGRKLAQTIWGLNLWEARMDFNMNDVSDPPAAQREINPSANTDEPADQEAEVSRSVQQDPETTAESGQIEEEIQLFTQMYNTLWGELAKQIKLEEEENLKTQEEGMEDQMQTWARRMTLLRHEVDELTRQYQGEADEEKRSERAQALMRRMRGFNFKGLQEKLSSLQNESSVREETGQKEQPARKAQEPQDQDTPMVDLENNPTGELHHTRMGEREGSRKREASASPPGRQKPLRNQGGYSSVRYSGGGGSQRPKFWRCCKCSGGWYSYQINDNCPMCQSWRCPSCEYSMS